MAGVLAEGNVPAMHISIVGIGESLLNLEYYNFKLPKFWNAPRLPSEPVLVPYHYDIKHAGHIYPVSISLIGVIKVNTYQVQRQLSRNYEKIDYIWYY